MSNGKKYKKQSETVTSPDCIADNTLAVLETDGVYPGKSDAIFVTYYRSKTNIAVKIVIQQHKIDVQMVRFTSLKPSAMVRFTWR